MMEPSKLIELRIDEPGTIWKSFQGANANEEALAACFEHFVLPADVVQVRIVRAAGSEWRGEFAGEGFVPPEIARAEFRAALRAYYLERRKGKGTKL